MSEHIARQAIARMHLRDVALAPHYGGMAQDMHMMAAASPEIEQQKFLTERRAELCAAYGFATSEQRKPFAFANGVAIIPVTGTLINRFGQSYGYVTGYNFIRQQHNAAILDPDVTHIIHDHNSYGGEAAGCFELSTEIFNSRGTKPILAVVDSNCYSASYALASAADKIIVTPSGGVGSIGVVAMHMDMSKMLNEWGIKITMIHSGDHKVDGNPYEPLPAAVKADIQKGTDKSRKAFVSLVARNRGLDEKVIFDTQAATFRTDDALSLGLIDMIATPQAALQSYIDDVEGSDKDDDKPEEEDIPATDDEEAALNQEPETMSTAEQQAAGAAAAAAPATPTPAAAAAPAANAGSPAVAERARIKEITTSAEAEGRKELAEHFAYNTDMSAADAKIALAVAPKAAATAPAVENAATFAAAMTTTGNPNVAADASAAAGGGVDKDAGWRAAIALQESATGVKLLDTK